jgi:hypothetical protein
VRIFPLPFSYHRFHLTNTFFLFTSPGPRYLPPAAAPALGRTEPTNSLGTQALRRRALWHRVTTHVWYESEVVDGERHCVPLLSGFTIENQMIGLLGNAAHVYWVIEDLMWFVWSHAVRDRERVVGECSRMGEWGVGRWRGYCAWRYRYASLFSFKCPLYFYILSLMH